MFCLTYWRSSQVVSLYQLVLIVKRLRLYTVSARWSHEHVIWHFDFKALSSPFSLGTSRSPIDLCRSWWCTHNILGAWAYSQLFWQGWLNLFFSQQIWIHASWHMRSAPLRLLVWRDWNLHLSWWGLWFEHVRWNDRDCRLRGSQSIADHRNRELACKWEVLVQRWLAWLRSDRLGSLLRRGLYELIFCRLDTGIARSWSASCVVWSIVMTTRAQRLWCSVIACLTLWDRLKLSRWLATLVSLLLIKSCIAICATDVLVCA